MKCVHILTIHEIAQLNTSFNMYWSKLLPRASSPIILRLWISHFWLHFPVLLAIMPEQDMVFALPLSRIALRIFRLCSGVIAPSVNSRRRETFYGIYLLVLQDFPSLRPSHRFLGPNKHHFFYLCVWNFLSSLDWFRGIKRAYWGLFIPRDIEAINICILKSLKVYFEEYFSFINFEFPNFFVFF